MILAVFSIFFGFITKDMFIGLGSGFFSDNALFIHPSHEIMLDTEFGVPTLFKLLPLVFTISLSVIAIVLSEYLSTLLIYFKLSRLGYNLFSFFNQRFLIELFYNRYITGTILKLGGQTTKVLDKGSVEYLGPYGLEKGLLSMSKHIARLSTGVITSYALYMLIALMAYLLFNSYINSSNVIIVLLISLSLLLLQSESSYYFRLHSFQSSSLCLHSSAILHFLIDNLDLIKDSIPAGQALLDAATAQSTTTDEVPDKIVSVARSYHTQLDAAYQAVQARAQAESVGANADTMRGIDAARNSADQSNYDGISRLRETVEVASELHEDDSNQ